MKLGGNVKLSIIAIVVALIVTYGAIPVTAQQKSPARAHDQSLIHNPLFSFKLPPGFATAEHQTKGIPTDIGLVQNEEYSSHTEDGATVAVMVATYPKAITTVSAHKVLIGGRDGALKKANAKSTKETFFTFDGYPALSMYFSTEGTTVPLYGRSCYILEGVHLYQLIYLCANSASTNSPEIEKFFNSVKLTAHH